MVLIDSDKLSIYNILLLFAIFGKIGVFLANLISLGKFPLDPGPYIIGGLKTTTLNVSDCNGKIPSSA
jgi:hypothetical protein